MAKTIQPAVHIHAPANLSAPAPAVEDAVARPAALVTEATSVVLVLPLHL